MEFEFASLPRSKHMEILPKNGKKMNFFERKIKLNQIVCNKSVKSSIKKESPAM